MGLPGAGKTTFTKQLIDACSFHIDAYNGDALREYYNDWDFSDEGRLRQAHRMNMMADMCVSNLGYHCVCDFVCPTEKTREIFNPDIIVWIDTIKQSRFENTNMCFEKPNNYTYRITDFDQNAKVITQIISSLE